MAPKVLKMKEFAKVFSTQVFFSAATTFGWTLAYLYLVLKGFSYLELAAYTVVVYATPIVVLLKTRTMFISRSMQLGMFVKMLTFAGIIFAESLPGLFLVGIFLGVSRVFYWIPYNVALMSLETKSAGLLSGLTFALPAVLGIALPFLGGLMAESYGFEAVFALSIVILFGGMWRAMRIKATPKINFDGRNSWNNTKGIKTLMTIHGFWQGVNWTAMPLITIFFLKSAISFGAFFTYLGVIGALSSIALGHRTDKGKNRQKIIYPAAVGLGVATFASGISGGLVFWALARGVVSFFDNIAAPFTFSVLVDSHRNLEQSFIANEMSLALGRTAGAIAVVLAIVSGNIYLSLVIAGLAYLLYPYVLKKKRIYC